VASWLYRVAVTRIWVTCRRYSIPLFRRRPPGLYKPYNRKGKERETKNETIILRTQSYEPISPTTDRYSRMVTFRRIRCTGKLHLYWLVVKPCAAAIWTGSWSKEETKSKQKQENIQKLSHLHILTSWPMLQQPSFPELLYLAVGHCRNPQGGRAAAHDLASMGASNAGIGCSLQRSSIV